MISPTENRATTLCVFWEQNRQVPPVPPGWLIPIPGPCCCTSTAPWSAGQGSDQAEVLLGHIFLAIFALQTEQFSHPACSVAPQRAEVAGSRDSAGGRDSELGIQL